MISDKWISSIKRHDEAQKKITVIKNDLQERLENFFPKLGYSINVEYLIGLNTQFPHVGVSDIVEKYNSKYQNQKIKPWHAFKLFKLLHLKKSIVNQKPAYVFLQVFRNEIYVYLRKFLALIKNGFNIIYVDESSVNRRSYKRLRLRIPRSDYFRNYRRNRIKNFKLDFKQILLATINEKNFYHKFLNANTNANNFAEFLKGLAKKIAEVDKNNRCIIYLDNSSIHHDPRVIETMNKYNLMVIYGPRYLCDLNYAEMIFSNIKNNYKMIKKNKKVNYIFISRLSYSLALYLGRLNQNQNLLNNYFRKFLEIHLDFITKIRNNDIEVKNNFN